MCSGFRMCSAVSGRGLWLIDRVLFGLSKSPVKRWKVLARRKYASVFGFYYNQYIFVMPGFFNFLTLALLILNNTLSISHSPRLLTAGPIQNPEDMESLLAILKVVITLF